MLINFQRKANFRVFSTNASSVVKTISMLLVSFILFFAAPSQAQSTGIEVKSENFIFIGDVSKKDGERLVKDLEIFRLSLFKLFGVELQTEAVPVRIYAFKKNARFQSFVKNKTVAGVYKKGSQGPMFVLDATGGVTQGDAARRVAMHEYVHHVIATYTDQKFPRWYNEGYANFLANFKIKDNKIIIGAPDKNYARYLRSAKWMPMDTLIASVNRYPFTSGSNRSNQRATQQAFYSQSWLAVTYMQTHPEYARKSTAYLNKINRGEDSIQAFNATFEQSPEDFGWVLKKFLKKNKYLHYPLPLKDSERNPPMITKQLDESQFKAGVDQARIIYNLN